MMQYEAFIRMLNAANIAHTAKDTGSGYVVSIRAGSGPNNEGYGHLYTNFSFNLDGELESVGNWERNLKLVS